MGSEWPPAAKTGPSKYGKTKLLNILNVHILSISDHGIVSGFRRICLFTFTLYSKNYYKYLCRRY